MSAAGIVVAAPLMTRMELSFVAVLHPEIEYVETPFLLATERLAALDLRRLEPTGTTALDQSYAISRALDLLFHGF